MPKEYSDRLKNLRSQFKADSVNKSSLTVPEYPEQLQKVKAKFTALVGGNFAFTPAIVKMVNGRKCEVYFAYASVARKNFLRPYLKLVTDFNGGTILEFKNAYYDDFADSKKYPLNTEFNATVPVSKTAKEQINRLKNLQTLYIQVREFAFDVNLSAADKRILNQYATCLSETVPVDLLNFCKDTEPEFFTWLNSNR